MTHIEALRLALEALESLQGGCTDSNDGTVEAITVWCPEVIDALRQAIEQTQKQEPVAWEQFYPDMGNPNLTPQRQWVGLTEDEILKFQNIVPNTLGYDLIEFARAIEAKLKEKNT